MKPWEETWRAEAGDPQWLINSDGLSGDYVANTLAGDDEVKARFIAAAPDMARALVALHANAVLFNRDSDAAWRELDTQVKDALRKAGVIP